MDSHLAVSYITVCYGMVYVSEKEDSSEQWGGALLFSAPLLMLLKVAVSATLHGIMGGGPQGWT